MFGIRESHVLDALRAPDQSDTLTQAGLVLRLHSKRIALAKPAHVLVIIENTSQNTIDFAIRIYPDLVANFDRLSPTHMLEAIANRFGMDLAIGTKMRGGLTAK